jgi:hypothetical protein
MSNRPLPLMKKHIYTIFPLRLCVKLFSQEWLDVIEIGKSEQSFPRA